MGLKDDIKPITYLKNHTAEVIRDVAETGCKYVITQNGEAKAVVIGVEEYDKWRNTVAMLKIASQSEADIREGRVISNREAFKRLAETIRRAEADD